MMHDPDASARRRVIVLIGLRVGGAVLLALGLYLAANDRTAVAVALTAAGALSGFGLPFVLIRRWRSPR